MPDRYITPKRATYLVIFLAVVVIAMGIWVILLSLRVSDAEGIRRAEDRGAESRADQGCAFLTALNDVSIAIPVQNLDDILLGDLTPAERASASRRLARYKKAEEKFAGPLRQCEARERAKIKGAP